MGKGGCQLHKGGGRGREAVGLPGDAPEDAGEEGLEVDDGPRLGAREEPDAPVPEHEALRRCGAHTLEGGTLPGPART